MKTLKFLFVAALLAGLFCTHNVVSAQATKTTVEHMELQQFCPCVGEFLWFKATFTVVENKNGSHYRIEGTAEGYADPDFTIPTGNVYEFRQVENGKMNTSGWTYQIWLDGKLISLTHINSFNWITYTWKNGFWCSPHNR